ncbi:MAG: LysM peptidoglycan-binding domain-containing protein [Chitinophagales bacterium]
MKNLALATLLSAGLLTAQAVTVSEHIVKPKENLFRIALTYNTTVQELLAANPAIKEKDLKVGTQLKVPANTKFRDARMVARLLSNPPQEQEAPQEDIFNNQADHKTGMTEAPATAAASEETQEASEVAATSSATQYETQELRDRYNELKKLEMGNAHIRVVDVNTVKVDPMANYLDTFRMLNETLNGNQVMVVNLQIVMKDGNTINLTNPEEQRRFISQMATGAAN